ncbi:RhaT Permeases of the drug/metabolite transporter (DMT) superfamily [Candidatus Nanopelagicaceae bacterium]
MASLLALLSSLLWGSADYHAGNLSKRLPTMVVLGINQAFGLAFGILLVLISGRWIEPTLDSSGYFINGALAGLCGYAGLLCLYAGLSTGRMGVVSPISSLSVLIPLFFALVIKGDQLSTPVTMGVIAAIIGGFLASGPEITQGLPIRPVLLALGAAFGFGSALTFMSIGSQQSSLLTMTTMRATTFIVSAAYFIKLRSGGGVSKSDIPLLAAIGIADFSANLLLGVATTKGLLSIAMVLGSLYPIATAVLAYIFLHERLHKAQYIGVVLAVGGVALISALQ